MKTTDVIIECVANISYGYENEKLKKITDVIKKVAGQKLLDVDSSASANRTVLTFAGKPNAVIEAAFQLIKTTSEIVDMRYHKGTHPRIGATDVCPFVPLQGISKKKTIDLSINLAQRVGEQLKIPVYLYESSAKKGYRLSLPQIRKGGYENLEEKMIHPNWKPDFGPDFSGRFRDSILKSGATVIGVRKILVAFNIAIATKSANIAKEIAYRIRTAGWPKSKRKTGNQVTNFSFPALRAIGWYSEDYACAQVSCNFTDYQKTSPLAVWEKVKELAKEYDCQAIGCEVVGLIPEICILEAGKFAARDKETETAKRFTQGAWIQLGVDHFRFNSVRPFNPKKKILEYRLQEVGN